MTPATRHDAIWRDVEAGTPRPVIAERYRVSRSYISHVVSKRRRRARAEAAANRRRPPMTNDPTLTAERARARQRREAREAEERRLTNARMLLRERWNAGPAELSDAARLLWPQWSTQQVDEAVRFALEIRTSERPRVDPADCEWKPPEAPMPRLGTERDRLAWERIFGDSLGARPVVPRRVRE